MRKSRRVAWGAVAEVVAKIVGSRQGQNGQRPKGRASLSRTLSRPKRRGVTGVAIGVFGMVPKPLSIGGARLTGLRGSVKFSPVHMD
jgi:hypothetical protein